MLSYGCWLNQKHAAMFLIQAAAMVFFRGELLILIAPTALVECVLAPRYNFFKGFLIGILSVIGFISMYSVLVLIPNSILICVGFILLDALCVARR